MNWYCKEFVSFLTVSSDKNVISYLNRLSQAGVPIENIKIVGMEKNWMIIYYYFTEKIS
jgi:hypothetical protein